MKYQWLLVLLALPLASCSGQNVDQSKKKEELDATVDRGFLRTHFPRYGGPEKNRAIIPEETGFRFQLPASEKGVAQTGVYSSFQLVGDFEISALYDLIAMPPPETGHGMTCGLAVDTEGDDGNVQFMRGLEKGNINGYIVSWGKRSVKDGHELDTRFARYGPETDQAITREDMGFRFKLPDTPDGLGQTGVSSKFQLTGDFEVSVTYELIAMTPPTKGYGVTCGISVDSDGPAGDVYLTRGYREKKRNGYVVTTAKPKSGGGTDYKNEDIPSTSQKGKLVLRRTGSTLICLVSDDPEDENPRPIRKIPFTKEPIKQIRIYADNGGSEGVLDARIADIKIKTEDTIDTKAVTSGMHYNDIKNEPSTAKKGKLVLRREKNELICLAADRPDADEEALVVIHRFPFTAATIKKVRVFADSGESPQALDARLADIKIQADKIPGARSKIERPNKWDWWVVPSGLLVLGSAVIGFLVYWRKRAEAAEDDE